MCFWFWFCVSEIKFGLLISDFKIKTVWVDLAGEGRFDFWISNFKFQKRFLAWGIESRKRPERCDDAGMGMGMGAGAKKARRREG